MTISEYETYGATNMVAEFKVDRRYKIQASCPYLCVAIHGGFAVLLPEDERLGVLTELIRPWLLENSIELPPEPGEYYRGEEVEVDLPWLGSSCNAKYICPASKGWHIAQQGDGAPSLVKSTQIRRIVPKPKTIRRPPTDQDAIDQPRRKCWVREQSPDMPWEPGILLSVNKFRGNWFYTAILEDDLPRPYGFCEIEVPNEC